jgi:hypothetical protein
MPLPLFAVPLVQQFAKGAKNVLGAALQGAKTSAGNRLAQNTQVTQSFGSSTQTPTGSAPDNKNQILIFGGIAAAILLFMFKKK